MDVWTVLLQAEEFCKRGLKPREVCVLTLYKRQVEIIRWLLRQKKLAEVRSTACCTLSWRSSCLSICCLPDTVGPVCSGHGIRQPHTNNIALHLCKEAA